MSRYDHCHDLPLSFLLKGLMPLSFGGIWGFIMGIWAGIGRADICVRIFSVHACVLTATDISKVQQTAQGLFAARFYGIMLVDLPYHLVAKPDVLSPTSNRRYSCESGIDGLFGNGGVGVFGGWRKGAVAHLTIFSHTAYQSSDC